jgi:hypothetical protein
LGVATPLAVVYRGYLAHRIGMAAPLYLAHR